MNQWTIALALGYSMVRFPVQTSTILIQLSYHAVPLLWWGATQCITKITDIYGGAQLKYDFTDLEWNDL